MTNSHCLLELTELATVPTLKAFSGLQECQALARGFDWTQDDALIATFLAQDSGEIGRSVWSSSTTYPKCGSPLVHKTAKTEVRFTV